MQDHGNINRTAVSATLHCLIGCSIGEMSGMVIGLTLGLGPWTTITLAITLAFLSGYLMTLRALIHSGLRWVPAIRLALAADTLSILIMEIVDNAVMMLIPGAMDTHPTDVSFWLYMILSLILAGIAAFPVNRWLISRGQGHAVVHQSHHTPHSHSHHSM